MAKVKNLKVRVNELASFVVTSDIVAVIMNALENRDILLFETICSEWTKKNIIEAVNELWSEAGERACKFEALQLRKKIEATTAEIENCEVCLNLKPNLYGKLAYHLKIFRLKREKVALREVISAFIAEHSAIASLTCETLLQELDARLMTKEMQSKFFIAADIEQLRPSEWPTPKNNYLSAEQVPYLASIIEAAYRKGLSREEITDAWFEMKKRKLDQMTQNKEVVSGWEYVDLADALCVLFAGEHPHKAKEHYAAYLDLVAKACPPIENISLASA